MPQQQVLKAASYAVLTRIVGLAACYFLAAKLSLFAAIPPGYATPVWPPSGIALAALLLLGPGAWPGIFLGATLVNLTVQASPLAALLMGCGNTLEALAGAALLHRFLGGAREFERGFEVLSLVGTGAASAAIAATVAAIPLLAVHALPLSELALNWWTWWQGDLMGIVLVTPLILGWTARGQLAWTASRALEGATLAVLLLSVTYLIFSDIANPDALTFLVLPFVMWAALRFRQREVTTLVALVCAIAFYFTINGRGPFAGEGLNVSLLLLLTFMSVISVSGLLLTAVVGERTHAMASLHVTLQQLHDQATTDALTGLYNRRFLEDYLARELARAERSGAPVALLMLDLDHFKRANDDYGHAAGDSVLRAVAALLKSHIRTTDVASRYGGEEFLLILPEAGEVVARGKAEDIRASLEQAGKGLHGVTVSIGIALFPAHGRSVDEVVLAADQAMYRAKAEGRNRVVVCAPPLASP